MALAQAPADDSDPLLRAMHDEAQRSAKVTVSKLDAPYFIQYLVDEEDNFTVSASLGGLVSRRREQFRQPEIQVRVGDYKFDNTNFAGFGMGGRGEGLPLENSYPVLRRYFWLETDSAYKAAVESFRASAPRCATSPRPIRSTISPTPRRCISWEISSG